MGRKRQDYGTGWIKQIFKMISIESARRLGLGLFSKYGIVVLRCTVRGSCRMNDKYSSHISVVQNTQERTKSTCFIVYITGYSTSLALA